MGITPGIPRPSGGGLGDIPASRMVGNFGVTPGPAIAVDSNQVIAWLDVPTNFAFGALSSTVLSLAGDLVGLETMVNAKVDTNDPRLGFIYDGVTEDRALSCADEEWTFGTDLQRDNLRIALLAQQRFNLAITGGSNAFFVDPAVDASGNASFYFSSHSGATSDNFGNLIVNANAEEGFSVSFNVENSGQFADIGINSQQVYLGFDNNLIVIKADSYEISKPHRLREAISAIGETFEAYNQNIFAYPIASHTVTGDRLDSITYSTPSGPFTRTFNYTGGRITSIVLSGAIPSGTLLTKTIAYSGNFISSTSYS